MSNFASLLGNLRQTAAKATEAQQNHRQRLRQPITKPSIDPRADRNNDHDRRSDKKRRRRHEPPHSSSSTAFVPPHDAHELTVEISFLCIGAQKAGTTWLHEILRRHPDLSLPEKKELHFWDWNRRKGLGWYSRQFPSVGGGGGNRSSSSSAVRKGEITPCYMALEDRHVREIAHLFPDLRVVFVARDLVDRAWSALLMELRNRVRGLPPGAFAPSAGGKDEEERRREEARVDRDADPEKYDDGYFMERLEHDTHTDRSDYAGALRKWTGHFPPERLLVLDYRDVADRPKELVRKVADHIGVETTEFLGDAGDGSGGVVGGDVLRRRVNSNGAESKKKGFGALRPSLRKKMEEYLRPFSKDFNSLLEELGYSWRLDEYDTTDSSTTSATVV